MELATGADEKDRFGLPVAKVTFSLHENDKKLIEFGKNKVMEIMRAAGAKEVVQEARYAHLVGAARMSATAGERSVRQVRPDLGCREPLCDGWLGDADAGLGKSGI